MQLGAKFSKLFLLLATSLLGLYLSPNNLNAQDFIWDGDGPKSVPLLQYERASQSSLRVLSWNVGSVDWSQSLQDQFLQNMTSVLSSKDPPDLIVLVESRPDNLNLLGKIDYKSLGYEKSLLLPHIENQFRTEFVTLLWKATRLNLQGHVNFPLEYKSLEKQDHNHQSSIQESIIARVEKDLPFIKSVVQNEVYFELENGKHFRVFPVHLTNIWGSVSAIYQAEALKGLASYKNMPDFLKASTALFESKKSVLQEILFSENNPHFMQTQSLIKQVQKSEVPSILLGDYNAFPKLSSITSSLMLKNPASSKSRACVEFEKNFTAVYPAEGHSFPSLSFKTKKTSLTPEILIDYAYTWGDLWKKSEAHVLPLKGSDHYPIVYEFQY